MHIVRILKKCVSVTIYRNFCSIPPDQRIEQLRKAVKKMTRQNPIIKKLDSPEFKSIFTDELITLASVFKEYGYEIRIAGGAVRDLLMDKKPKDVDFATTATPDQMKDMFTEKNIRMLNMKGEKHGTITPRINDKENFEVTTLRIDVVTDGRHAEVQYTTDWLLDANRRDLTINSMFLDLDGNVYDYFYGYDDLKKRRIAFVGDATTRIQEDYLRILRYFRFYGKVAKSADAHEEATLTAIRQNVDGLSKISGERIWMELKKILEGNFAVELLCKIIESGISPYISLPENINIENLKSLWERSKYLNLKPITILSSLFSNEQEALDFHNRLKLSRYDRDLLIFLLQHREQKIHEKPLMPYMQILLKANKISDTREWIVEALKYNNSPYLEEFKMWELPKFPISGVMLKEAGVESGKFMGYVLNELKNIWIESEFNVSGEELMQKVPHVVGNLKEKRKIK